MKLRIPLVLLVGLCLLFPHITRSQLGDAAFHRYDKDSDGVVTATELPDASVRARFDQDGDGEVTIAEYRATVRGQTAPAESEGEAAEGEMSRLDAYIAAADTNGDGKLSREETGGARWFKRIDQDGDGFIGEEEIERVRMMVAQIGTHILPSAPERPVSEAEITRITSGPEIVKPGDVGIGRMIPDAEFTDIDGKSHRIGEVRQFRGAVIAMTSATCPVSKRYLPTLAELEPKLAEQNIALVLVNAFGSESEEEIRAQLANHSFSAPYVHDKDKSLSRALEAKTTTEIFLIDSKQTLLYRGALDDQYGIDYSVQEARHHYLVDAVTAFLEGKPIEIAATAAPGCELDLGTEAGGAVTEITYHRDVARILQQNCVRCHHEGGIAPFALDDFEEVSDRTRVIRRVVTEGTMPPWFAAPPEGGGPSPWVNDHSLSERDKADVLAWLESSDKPMGDPADAPAPLEFATEWSIGEPDLVIPLSKAYEVPATGFIPYRYDTVETELTEEKWVTAYEILPSERDVVHHVIVQVFEKGASVKQRAEGAGGYWAAYVPGNGAHAWPEGFAKRLPAGAKISFQIHYTPSGTAKSERLKMGLKFAEEPPEYEVKTLAIADRRLNIPPGAAAHVEGASRKATFDVPALSFMPHMHTRGAAFSYELIHPDGTTEMLLDIPRYDFNWQLRYDLKEPKLIPRGSSVKVTGVFDNSEANKANPDPTKTVKWGNQTVDEMLIGYIEYFVPVVGDEVALADQERMRHPKQRSGLGAC